MELSWFLEVFDGFVTKLLVYLSFRAVARRFVRVLSE